jgi:hypothetical protein
MVNGGWCFGGGYGPYSRRLGLADGAQFGLAQRNQLGIPSPAAGATKVAVELLPLRKRCITR